MIKGIYTLANDAVYDQLVALLNSIEANYGKNAPICVIPYDDNIAKIREELVKRGNVTLFEDTASIARWEEFAKAAWNLKPEIWGRHKLGVHRKFCCFDGPFDRFIFLDADTLVMKPLDFIYEQLDRSDFVVYDYQHKDVSHVYNAKSPRLYQIFPKERIDAEIFCTGFFASKRCLFDETRRNQTRAGLRDGDAEILYPRAPEQSLVNYMIMKIGVSAYNFAAALSRDERTGNAVTSSHFEAKDNVLYDKGRRLTYLHYIGITSGPFRKLCAGENIDFPYRDIFLHYRYLHEPEKRPFFKGKPRPYRQSPSLLARIFKEIRARF